MIQREAEKKKVNVVASFYWHHPSNLHCEHWFEHCIDQGIALTICLFALNYFTNREPRQVDVLANFALSSISLVNYTFAIIVAFLKL